MRWEKKIKNIFILLKSVMRVPKTLVILFYILNSEKNTFNTSHFLVKYRDCRCLCSNMYALMSKSCYQSISIITSFKNPHC